MIYTIVEHRQAQAHRPGEYHRQWAVLDENGELIQICLWLAGAAQQVYLRTQKLASFRSRQADALAFVNAFPIRDYDHPSFIGEP